LPRVLILWSTAFVRLSAILEHRVGSFLIREPAPYAFLAFGTNLLINAHIDLATARVCEGGHRLAERCRSNVDRLQVQEVSLFYSQQRFSLFAGEDIYL
jgi:hypothetical protein